MANWATPVAEDASARPAPLDSAQPIASVAADSRRYNRGARFMPAVSVTVVSPNTKLISPRVAPIRASTGFSSTLNAYSVPKGRLMIVAATSDVVLLFTGSGRVAARRF